MLEVSTRTLYPVDKAGEVSVSQPQLGTRVRALRQAKGYTLEQVSVLSGLSKSFLSMLENGKTRIAADKLERLAGIFGLRASDLLPDSSSQSLIQVVHAGEGPRIKGFGRGVDANLLTKDLHRRIQPVLMKLARGASHKNVVGHAGEEFIYILSGRLELTVDTLQVLLAAGDAAYYPCALSHSFLNVDEEEVVLVTISTPPKLI